MNTIQSKNNLLNDSGFTQVSKQKRVIKPKAIVREPSEAETKLKKVMAERHALEEIKQKELQTKFEEQIKHHTEMILQDVCLPPYIIQDRIKGVKQNNQRTGKTYNSFSILVNYSNNVLDQVEHLKVYKEKILRSKDFEYKVKQYYRENGSTGVGFVFPEDGSNELRIAVFFDLKPTSFKVEVDLPAPNLKGSWATSGSLLTSLKEVSDKDFVTTSTIADFPEIKPVAKPVVTFESRLVEHTTNVLKDLCLTEDFMVEQYEKGSPSVSLEIDFSQDVLETFDSKKILKSKIVNDREFKEKVTKYYTDLGCSKVFFGTVKDQQDFYKTAKAKTDVPDKVKITIYFEQKETRPQRPQHFVKQHKSQSKTMATDEKIMVDNRFQFLEETD